MPRIRRHLTASLLAMLVAVSGFGLAGPAAASAPRAAASAVAAKPHTPCGIKHYPRCPPKHKIGGQKDHHVKQGHRYHLHASHFPKHAKITAHIKGHHHNKLVYASRTNKHGNKTFSVKIPSNLKPGKYTLVVKVGGTVKKIHIHVKKAHKHHG